jgi:uncharacterized protein (TIGR02117 family)
MRRVSKRKLLMGLLILVAACASSPPVVRQSQDDPSRGAPVTVYVAGHGWHTGIIVPAVDMKARLPALEAQFADTPFLEFGWGDRDFYQAEEITAGVALKAVLWPTASVMHVVAVPADVTAFFPRSEIHRLCLSRERYAGLLDFIAGSFRRSDDGALTGGGSRGLYGHSRFYDAVGNYTLFNTCNTWTAKGLKSAGFDIGTAFKATASSVMRFLRETDAAAGLGCGPEPGIPAPALSVP